MTAYSKPYDSLAIPGSGEQAHSIASFLGLSDAELAQVVGVEIAAHSAAFYVGTSSALAAKRTIPAYEPYYRVCNGSHLRKTFIRAVGASAIASVEAEVEFKAVV